MLIINNALARHRVGLEGGGARSLSWLPLVVLPRGDERHASEFLPRLKACCERYLPRLGSVLLRGFEIGEAPEFRGLVASLAGAGAQLDFPAASEELSGCGPRCAGEATPEPGPILHNARTYLGCAPHQLWLWCTSAPSEADAIELADCRDVRGRVPETIRERWMERGLLYVRDFEPLPALAPGDDSTASAARPWIMMFGSAERSAVEASCQRRGFQFAWSPAGALRIWRACAPIVAHPISGESVWFNQAHVFVAPRGCPPSDPARHASSGTWRVYHADGGGLDASEVLEVRAAFESCKTLLSWEPQDVLVIDNLLTAHAVPGSSKTLIVLGQ
jgi:hypothetical protein